MAFAPAQGNQWTEMARGRGIRIGDVVRTALAGIGDAQAEYEEWSNFRLWIAPEYLVTTSIARALRKLDGVGYVTMEKSVKEAIKEARGNWQGRRSEGLPEKGRFDLVVWNQSIDPRVIIEVKAAVEGYSTIAGDVKKVCAAMRRTKNVKGLVAYYVSLGDGKRKDGASRVAGRADAIAAKVRANLPANRSLKYHKGDVQHEAGRAWIAAMLQIG